MSMRGVMANATRAREESVISDSRTDVSADVRLRRPRLDGRLSYRRLSYREHTNRYTDTDSDTYTETDRETDRRRYK